MKTCPNCGHQMTDETRYCAACGTMLPDDAPQSVSAEPAAPIQEPTAPQPPQDWAPTTPPTPPQGGNKKPFIIGAVAAAAVVCIGVGIFFMMNRAGGESKLPDDPAGQFKAIQTGYVDNMFAAMDNAPVNTTPEKVSTDLTITAQYDDNGEISSYLEGTSIGFQVDATQNSALMGLDFTFKNTPIVSGTLTYGDGIIGLCVPELADSWYTMDLERFIERYAEGELPDLSQLTAASTVSLEEFHTLVNSYLDILLSMATDENTVKEENVSFTLEMLSEDRTGTRYTLTPTEKDLEDMLLALADQLEKDELLRKVLTSSGSTTYELPDLEEQIADAVETIREGAAGAAKEIADEHLTWTLYTDKGSVKQTLVGDSFHAFWESSEKGTGARITVGGEDVLDFSFVDGEIFFSMDADGEELLVTGTYSENHGKFSFDLNVSVGTDFYFSMACSDVSENKTSSLGIPYGSYDFSLWDGYEDVSFRFDVRSAENGGTDHVLSLSIPGASTPEFDLDKLTITINSTDRPSTIQKPTAPQVDVTDYSEADFEALGAELSNAATALMFKLMMALYS